MIVRRLPSLMSYAGLCAGVCCTLAVAAGLASADLAASSSGGAVAPNSVRANPAHLDTVVMLPEVRVDRARATSDARRRAPTSFVTELSAGDAGRAFETLGDLLMESPGVHLQQYGGLGAFSTVSLRGAPSSQVAVYLDGAPLQSGAHPVVNLAEVPFSAVERVDVYRGGSPLSFGLAGAGGAINLVTLRRAAGADLRVMRGSFDSWDARATGAAARGPLSGMLNVALQSSAGDYPYLDDNGTPFNADDDSVHARINGHFESLAAMGSLDWRAGSGAHIGLREQLSSRQQGVPGLGAVPAYETQLENLHSLTQLEAAAPGRAARPDLLLRGDLGRQWTRFEDPNAELGLGAHASDDAFGDQGLHAELGWRTLPLGFAAELAADLRHEQAQLSDAADVRADPPTSEREQHGAMAALEWRSAGSWLLLRAASRWDRVHDALRTVTFGDQVQASDVTHELRSPQFGARMTLPFEFEGRANWSAAERVPDFGELFGDQGSVLGNPLLVPEHTDTRDAGLAWTLPARGAFAASASWAHFASRFENLILYVRNSQSSVRAQNVASARIDGDEFALRLSTPLGLALQAAYTHQIARDSGPVVYWNGKFLPQRPEHEGDLRLSWSRAGVRAAAELQWLGLNYLDRYNRYRVDSRELLSASLGVPLFMPAARLTIEGKNLTDDRATDVAGFPLPGRTLFVALEARLGPPASADR